MALSGGSSGQQATPSSQPAVSSISQAVNRVRKLCPIPGAPGKRPHSLCMAPTRTVLPGLSPGGRRSLLSSLICPHRLGLLRRQARKGLATKRPLELEGGGIWAVLLSITPMAARRGLSLADAGSLGTACMWAMGAYQAGAGPASPTCSNSFSGQLNQGTREARGAPARRAVVSLP